MAKWKLTPIQPGDKEITILAGEIRVTVDYDDVDHGKAESVARFIVAMQSQYAAWKALQTKGRP